MKPRLPIIAILCGLLTLQSCENFLAVKPDRSVIIPSKLEHFQALLDKPQVMNSGTGHLLGEISGDNYYVQKTVWQALSSPYERNAYLWSKEIFEGAQSTDWNNPSLAILYANLALEGVSKISPEAWQTDLWKNVKGSALFFRSYAQFQMAQLFCNTYVQATASEDLGIPLRLESDITIKTSRATVEQTYQQILTDLTQAAELLPKTPAVKTRPSRPAAYALLARVFIQMQNYQQALHYASASLADYNTLLNYNTVDSLASFPFKVFNQEVIFHSTTLSSTILNPSRLSVAPELYEMYEKNDLRKVCFFTSLPDRIRYKGSYNGSNAFFTGISTAEVVLTLAESQARLGMADKAAANLNLVLEARYKKGTFVVVTGQNPEVLLERILKERRKELPFRGIRWSDLKRLNLDKRFAASIQRGWENESVTLEPGSPRYIFPIPEAVIQISGIQQNQR